MELVSLIIFHGLTGVLSDFFLCCIELTRLGWGGGGCRLCSYSRGEDVVVANTEEGGDGGGGGTAEELTGVDAAAVLGRLGMVFEGEGMREGVVGELLEEKEASEWELEEAFYVFDRNEDGFITAVELWNVMRRLGFEEGRRVEDCERMIKGFDEDGDGRISFLEFRRLMDNAM